MQRDFLQLASLPSVDAEYRFGRPKVYLTAHELARLTLVRSKLGDTRLEREAERVVRSSERRAHAA
jgi:hypothetical protein